MSKIGQKQIEVPASVTVDQVGNVMTVKGAQGTITLIIPSEITVKKEGTMMSVERSSESKKVKSVHGLIRQLISNAVIGVEKPWEKRMEVVGTGYNVKMQGEDLLFKLGYSHPSLFKKVLGISYKVDGNTNFVVMGPDKQLVGQVAYQIKTLKKPDAYKGKGIRYEGEQLRIKPGKKAKAAGGAPGAAA